jgi:hypothetical protein
MVFNEKGRRIKGALEMKRGGKGRMGAIAPLDEHGKPIDVGFHPVTDDYCLERGILTLSRGKPPAQHEAYRARHHANEKLTPVLQNLLDDLYPAFKAAQRVAGDQHLPGRERGPRRNVQDHMDDLICITTHAKEFPGLDPINKEIFIDGFKRTRQAGHHMTFRIRSKDPKLVTDFEKFLEHEKPLLLTNHGDYGRLDTGPLKGDFYIASGGTVAKPDYKVLDPKLDCTEQRLTFLVGEFYKARPNAPKMSIECHGELPCCELCNAGRAEYALTHLSSHAKVEKASYAWQGGKKAPAVMENQYMQYKDGHVDTANCKGETAKRFAEAYDNMYRAGDKRGGLDAHHEIKAEEFDRLRPEKKMKR